MTRRHATRRPGLAMLILFWGLFIGLGAWWAQGWLDEKMNPNAHLQSVAPGEPLTLKRGPGGHFVAPGRINGQEVRFLLDTGATRVALPDSLANELGLESEGSAWFRTANGRVRGDLATLERVSLAGLEARNVPGSISPGLEDDMVLLGMSFLGRFDIAMRGDTLTLSPPASVNSSPPSATKGKDGR